MSKSVILSILVFSACTVDPESSSFDNSNRFSYRHFTETIKLKGDPIFLPEDVTIYAPYYIGQYDSMFVIRDGKNDENSLHFLDGQMNYIGGYGKKGDARGLYLGIKQFTSYRNSDLTIFDITRNIFSTVSVDSALEDTRYIPSNEVKPYGYLVDDFVQVSFDNFVISYNLTFKNRRGALVNKDFKILREFGEFPLYDKVATQKDSTYLFNTYSRLYNARLHYDPFDELIVIFYGNTSLVEIYSLDLSKELTLVGPHDNFPLEFGTDDRRIQCKNCRFTYRGAESSEDKFYFLFSGKRQSQEAGYLSNKILEFDKSGNPGNLYVLDEEIVEFYVDKAGKYLYGLVLDKKYPIVVYQLR